MGIKKYSNLFVLILLYGSTLAGYLWFINQPFFQGVIDWAQQNFALYFVVLVLVKIASIIWPPLPGGLLTLGSIPVIGWFPAFLAEALGAIGGATIAYFLGRKYGYRFLQKIFSEGAIVRIQRIKIKKEKELEAVFFLRIFTGALFSEAISYGSGVIGIKYRNFFFATLFTVVLALPMFYFLNEIFVGRNIVIYVPIVLLFAFVFWRMRGRYFE